MPAAQNKNIERWHFFSWKRSTSKNIEKINKGVQPITSRSDLNTLSMEEEMTAQPKMLGMCASYNKAIFHTFRVSYVEQGELRFAFVQRRVQFLPLLLQSNEQRKKNDFQS